MRRRCMFIGMMVFMISALTFDAAPQGVVRFKLVNASKRALQGVHVSSSTTATWGENLLKEVPLRPKGTVTLQFPGTCGSHDVRVVVDADTEIVGDDVDLCDENDIVTVGDDLLTKRRLK